MRQHFLALAICPMFAVAIAIPATDASRTADTPPRTAEETLRPVPLIGQPCEGCEAAFDGIPADIPHVLQLRTSTEPGTAMTVHGRVLDRSGKPRTGIILYVHQTDAAGVYPLPDRPGASSREARRHGRLRGWVRSDGAGWYRIETIRPGSYPGESIPEHIHIQVIEPGCFTYFIDDLMFRDDPKLTPALLRTLATGMGGNGVIVPEKIDGEWHVRRDIVLGRQVPGYRDCASASS